jgi:hypothetical protein
MNKLLKIGECIYINPEHIAAVESYTGDDERERVSVQLTGGDRFIIQTQCECDALLKWLDANSVDLMADDAAVGKWEPKFKVGDRVRVLHDSKRQSAGLSGVIEEVDPEDTINFTYRIQFDDGTDDVFEEASLDTFHDSIFKRKPTITDEATGEPHFCDAGDCEAPAANFDNITRQWYCNRHYTPF